MLKLQLSYSGIAMQTRLSEIAHTLAFLLQDFITYIKLKYADLSMPEFDKDWF